MVFYSLISPARCASEALSVTPTREVIYSLTTLASGAKELGDRFSPNQLQILEKLNRCDLTALARLTIIVAPESWFEDEQRDSPLPL